MCNNTQKKLCNEDCEICFNRSFVSHPKSEFWSNLNQKTPRQVFKHSNIYSIVINVIINLNHNYLV